MNAIDWQGAAETWLAWVLRALVDGTVVFVIVAAIWWPLRKRAPAQLGYGLFLLVPLKLLLPFEIALPAPLAALSPSSWLGTATAPAPLAPAMLAPALGASLPTPTPSASAPALLFAAYLAIVAFLAVRLLWMQVRTLRLVRGARPLRPGELCVGLQALCARAGLRGAVRFLVTDGIDSPAAGGLRTPYVLLPEGLLARLAPRPLQWILLHELAHVRRCDVPVSMLQRFAQILFFFHPALWAANRIIDEQREFACDQDALAASDADRSECGEGFLSVVEWVSGRGRAPGATLAMFDSNSVTRRRLMRLLNTTDRSTRLGKLLSGSVIAIAASLLLPTVRASDAVALDSTATLRVQDPEQIRKLRDELAKLQAAQEKLRAKLDAMTRKAKDSKDREDSDVEEIEEVIELEGDADAPAGRKAVLWMSKDGKAAPARVRAIAPRALQGAKGGVFVLERGEDGPSVRRAPVAVGQGRAIVLPRGAWRVEGKLSDEMRERLKDRLRVKIDGAAKSEGDGEHEVHVEVIEAEGKADGHQVIRVLPKFEGGNVIIETKVERGDDEAGEHDVKKVVRKKSKIM
jgi:beta-lactamase regulating signal transducer with metallopeptidase domain